MSGTRRRLMLLVVLVAMMAGCFNTAVAQVATTTVQDTVYSANGTPASGTVLVNWNTFTTAEGQPVPAGSTSATIGAGGQLTIALAPNAGSTPIGSYYTAVFHLSDGTTSREFWVVPVTVPGGGPATLAEIKNQVLPTSVAMQTVSKQYVDNAIAAAATGFPLDTSPYVMKVGDTMTGPLVLPGDPVSPNQAADKNYVDENIAATAGGLGQKVSLLPEATQVVAQPSGTSFSIDGTSAATTFSGTGTSSQGTITSANTTANPGTSGYTLFTNENNCFQSGYDLGNNGTSAQGWSTCALSSDVLESATRGISQLHAGDFSHFAQGDTAAFYTYLTAFGGVVASSDEAVTHTVEHANQIGYYSGAIATGGTTGSNLLTTSSFGCHGFCATLDNAQFADGGILLDTSRGGSTATLATEGNTMNGTYYTLASGTVPVSTAWGNILPSSCTNNGNGQWQNYTSTTCNITLGTSPASPGNFVAGKDACLAGPFQEEAAVTAVGTPSAGVPSITFNTRYAWNNTNASLVMQGGPCGQSLVATNTVNSWPVAYAVVGATSSTQVFFSNCVVGSCNGGGNIISASSPIAAGNLNFGSSLTRSSNVVTFTGFVTGLVAFPAGSTIIVSGATPSDLNGTFTVLTNNMDNTAPLMTWAQSGTNETATVLPTISQPPTGITFFPSAFITGTNNGAIGNVQLATNSVPFATGDTVVGAPTSQYSQSGLNVYIGQNTATTGSLASSAINVTDQGPSQLTNAYTAFNSPGNGVATDMFSIVGSYAKDFDIGFRPANNGVILFVQGGEPVSANNKPYYVFLDDGPGAGGSIEYNPTSNIFTLNGGGVSAPGYQINGSWGTSGQCLVSTGSGTKFGTCGSGSGGSGTVTSIAAGTWPSWLTPTVTNATTTPSIAVAASAIPNAALANSATTVNGQTCALGGTCTIATGSVTPPLTYTYFPAAVSDGGDGFAGGFARYNSNQPQAGSVAPATSALGYLLFQATPTLPQYAEMTTTAPPFWTSTGLYINFYSTATSGNAVLDVQTACVTPGQAVGSPTFSTAIVTTTPVSSTANGLVKTALISGIATPGANGCPALGMTTPTMLTVRVYADATSAVPVNFTGATLVTGRSQ
jgi:trimeric autotransporter adhesin